MQMNIEIHRTKQNRTVLNELLHYECVARWTMPWRRTPLSTVLQITEVGTDQTTTVRHCHQRLTSLIQCPFLLRSVRIYIMELATVLHKTKVLVMLSSQKHKIVVPVEWIKLDNINPARTLMYGIKKGEDRVVFVSNNQDHAADFDLPIRDAFSGDEDACYLGRVLKIVSEFKTTPFDPREIDVSLLLRFYCRRR